MSALRNPPGAAKELPRMSEVGRTIFRIVKEQPGIHFRGLGRAAQLTSAGQLRHHLDRLERQGLLVELEDGRYKRFFVAGDHDRTLRPGLARFARAVPRKIGKLLLVHPMNRTELRRSLGCADSTLGYHLKRMIEQGDLEKQRGRNCCRYSLTNAELVQQVLMLQGTERDYESDEEVLAEPMAGEAVLPALRGGARMPGLGQPVPAMAGLSAPEPDEGEEEEEPEPVPEPFEPMAVPEMGTPAPAVVPLYLIPTTPESEPEPVPQEETPPEEPVQPAAETPALPPSRSEEKVQEP